MTRTTFTNIQRALDCRPRAPRQYEVKISNMAGGYLPFKVEAYEMRMAKAAVYYELVAADQIQPGQALSMEAKEV